MIRKRRACAVFNPELEMNDMNHNHLSLFFDELNTLEGDKKVKKLNEVFESELDEARYNFIQDAKKQIDALQNKSGRLNKYGCEVNAWTEQQRDTRWKTVFKSGTTVLELIDGKTHFFVPTREEACKLIAHAAVCAEKRLFDKYLVVEKKAKKQSKADALVRQVLRERDEELQNQKQLVADLAMATEGWEEHEAEERAADAALAAKQMEAHQPE